MESGRIVKFLLITALILTVAVWFFVDTAQIVKLPPSTIPYHWVPELIAFVLCGYMYSLSIKGILLSCVCIFGLGILLVPLFFLVRFGVPLHYLLPIIYHSLLGLATITAPFVGTFLLGVGLRKIRLKSDVHQLILDVFC